MKKINPLTELVREFEDAVENYLPNITDKLLESHAQPNYDNTYIHDSYINHGYTPGRPSELEKIRKTYAQVAVLPKFRPELDTDWISRRHSREEYMQSDILTYLYTHNTECIQKTIKQNWHQNFFYYLDKPKQLLSLPDFSTYCSHHVSTILLEHLTQARYEKKEKTFLSTFEKGLCGVAPPLENLSDLRLAIHGRIWLKKMPKKLQDDTELIVNYECLYKAVKEHLSYFKG